LFPALKLSLLRAEGLPGVEDMAIDSDEKQLCCRDLNQVFLPLTWKVAIKGDDINF
jgi:hypothetical protein